MPVSNKRYELLLPWIKNPDESLGDLISIEIDASENKWKKHKN